MAQEASPLASNPHRKQLWGWMSYAFASEVFAVCSLGLFLPICLEQFARDNGYLLPDRTQPCSSAAEPSSGGSLDSEVRCAVRLLWFWVDSASFSLYVYSASVAIQALTVISMGGVADHPSQRKLILLGFAAMGSLAAAFFLLLPSTSPLWFLSAFLAVVANVSFGASIVALNSYLPGLAKSSPAVLSSKAEVDRLQHEAEVNDMAHDKVVEAVAASNQYNKVLSTTTSRVSSQGIAIGYTGGIFLLMLTLIPVGSMHGSTFSLRLAISMSGLWWAFFSLPAAIWLPGGTILWKAKRGRRDEEQDLLEETLRAKDAVADWTVREEIKKAWLRLIDMVRPSEMRKLHNTFMYLAAWFLLSDGFATITSTAILFAKTSLNMSAMSLIGIGAVAPLAGIAGSLLWPQFQRRVGWSNLHILVMLILVTAIVPFYGCLGFVPWLQKAKFGGLTSPAEMWVLAVYFGMAMGAFQSYARSVFAELIPPGEEARWYGLYSITDKSSSFFGPLVVGLISDATGNIRFAFFFLFVMLLLPVPILMVGVDVDRGREDAAKYSEAKMEEDGRRFVE